MQKTTSTPVIEKGGFSFSFLQPDKPDTRNMLDLLCVALSKMAEPNDPVIVEAWRALERQFQSGSKDGYAKGYIAGLAHADALLLADAEIKQISKRSQR
jgi:hypothetical protein